MWSFLEHKGAGDGWGWEAIRVTCVEPTCRVQKSLGENDTRVTNHPGFLRTVPILALKVPQTRIISDPDPPLEN